MNVVLQDGIKDCGICCLLSIIRFYGGEVPKEYLRELTNTTRDGVTLYNLLEASKKIGFMSEGLTGKLEDIDVNNLPCIAHINIKSNYKHFIVIYKIDYKKKQLTIMDPAKGKRHMSFAEYKLQSSSNYLFLKPEKKIPILKKKNIVYQKIKKLLKNHTKLFIIIFILTSNHFILNIITSFHFKYIIDYAIQYNLSNNLYTISVVLLCIYLLKNITNSIRDILLNKLNSLFSIEIMTFTYQQILLLPYLYFKNRTSGEVLSRFQDLGIIRDYLTCFFCTITTDMISCILFFIVMYKYNPKLTILINILLLSQFFYILLTSNKRRKKLKKIKSSEDIINSYLIQGISNTDTIKGSHLEKRFIDKFEINYKSFQEGIYKFQNNRTLDTFIKNNGKDFILQVLYGLGSYLVIKEKLTLGNLIIFQSILNYYSISIMNIMNLLSNYYSYKVTLDRIEELFMIDKEEFQNSYFYLPYTLEGDIKFQNLNYKIGIKTLFNNLNLTIYRGDKVLISGESGCGKSTLMKMLMRYIETDYNTIQIAGIDINHYHLQNIRTNITYITSNEYLFQDSIRNNICLYKEYEEETFQKVCDLCCVTELIKSKNLSFDSMIEENGFNFSNGERQRIILARALMRRSNIYILDEALGQIDINHEKKILENLFSYLPDKTIIVISHRFNNKKKYNRVLKLEQGEIHENKKL